MARYRKIDTRIWNDAKFNELSESAKLVFFFELTHPNLTMLGAMRATVPGLAAELGMPAEAFAEAFREILEKGMAKHDERTCFFWLPKFLKYNKPESPNVVKSWPDAFDLLPECPMKSELFQQLRVFIKDLTKGFNEAFAEAFPKAFAKNMPNQEPEPEPESISPAAPANQNGTPVKRKTPKVPEAVLVEIYLAYPRRVGKREALKAIEKAIRYIAPSKDAQWLLGRTRAFAQQRRGEEEQYTPFPARWFNEKRFEDESLDGSVNGASRALHDESYQEPGFTHPSRVMDFRVKAGLQ